MSPENDLQTLIRERLASLPLVVRQAIASSDVEGHLRTLANTHKLHLDQWEILENQVMLALLGIRRAEEMEEHISQEVGVSIEIAKVLAEDINIHIFEPIREELERQLEHPAAEEKVVSDIQAAGEQQLQGAREQSESNHEDTPSQTVEASPAPSMTPPGTPPAPKTDVKVTRPSESTAYKPGETSAARATVHDDPYRELPL